MTDRAGGASTMPAAVYLGDRRIEVQRLPVPEPGPGELLLEVSHCGICGTDLHMVLEGWGRPGTTGGHEYSGTVVATGPGTDGWATGDRAVGGPGRGCGRCRPCTRGLPHLCLDRPKAGVDRFQGAFATFKAVPAGSAYRVPDGVDLRTASLTEPLAVAYHGVQRAVPPPGGRALVTGAGPIGLLVIAVLRHLGIESITVSEPGALRRERALAVGASAAVTPDRLEAPAGMPMDVADEPFDVAYECSGRADAMEAALGLLDRRGALVLVGSGLKRPRFDPNRILLNELTVTGSAEYTPDDFERSLELLATAPLPVAHLLEPVDVALSGLLDAMERLAAGELAGKVLVAPSLEEQ